MQKSTISILCFSLMACTVSPQIMPPSTDSSCHLTTREVELDYEWLPANFYQVNCHNKIEECLGGTVAVAGLWTVGSTLVSGSIYLTGNTLHWLEYQGRCADSELRRGLAEIQALLSSPQAQAIALPDSTLSEPANTP